MSTPDDGLDHRRPSNQDIYIRLDRIEDKLDRRLNSLDDKVDQLTSRMDRQDGALGMLKWLGPTGIAALILALLQSAGVIT